MNIPLILIILVGWTVLGFLVWTFLTVGHEYREPITESDIKAMREEAERAASLAEACPWPVIHNPHSAFIVEERQHNRVA